MSAPSSPHPPADLRLIRLEESDQVLVVTLNRPQVHNAISLAMMDELNLVLDYVSGNIQIGTVILTGAGERTFSSGGDLKEFDTLRTRVQALDLSLRMQGIMRRLRELEVPVIAALNGDAYGGGLEVAMGCDMRIASRAARFGFLQITLGITPAWGGRDRMIEAIGRAGGLMFMLSGEVLSADEAGTLGMIDKIVEPGEALPAARDLARRMARHAPLAIRAIKRAVNRAPALTADDAMRFEAESFADTWLSNDHWEALAARKEKRSPLYHGD
jgi:enoyl-CoA hydratase